MDIISELEFFYNSQADKFHETRKKHWVEFDIILDEIKKNNSTKIKILEIGCGAGRFCKYLKENLQNDIEYTGIDLSKNLIKIAQMNNESGSFFVGEMNNFLAQTNQEEYDFIIAIASFQHLPNFNSRVNTMKNIYRSLKYGGKCIMLNRSFSKWFLKKYKFDILKSAIKTIITLGTSSRKDIYIPWKDNNNIFHRFYHIFTISEIKSICQQAGFCIQKTGYINTKGNISNKWIDSRNSLIISEKAVICEKN